MWKYSPPIENIHVRLEWANWAENYSKSRFRSSTKSVNRKKQQNILEVIETTFSNFNTYGRSPASWYHRSSEVTLEIEFSRTSQNPSRPSWYPVLGTTVCWDLVLTSEAPVSFNGLVPIPFKISLFEGGNGPIILPLDYYDIILWEVEPVFRVWAGIEPLIHSSRKKWKTALQPHESRMIKSAVRLYWIGNYVNYQSSIVPVVKYIPISSPIWNGFVFPKYTVLRTGQLISSLTSWSDTMKRVTERENHEEMKEPFSRVQYMWLKHDLARSTCTFLTELQQRVFGLNFTQLKLVKVS